MYLSFAILVTNVLEHFILSHSSWMLHSIFLNTHFILCVSVWRIPMDISLNSLIISLALRNLLTIPLMTFYIFVTMWFISFISISFYIIVSSLSWNSPLFHAFVPFSARFLNRLIIENLNSFPGCSNIRIISESGCVHCFYFFFNIALFFSWFFVWLVTFGEHLL